MSALPRDSRARENDGGGLGTRKISPCGRNDRVARVSRAAVVAVIPNGREGSRLSPVNVHLEGHQDRTYPRVESLIDSRRAERSAGFLTRYLKFADKNVHATFEGNIVLCRPFE